MFTRTSVSLKWRLKMTFSSLNGVLHDGIGKQLLSKRGFDTVKSLNNKPSAETEGLDLKSSDLVKSDSGKTNNSILSETPNLYKQNGVSMSQEGFIKLPRSILSSDEWRNLTFRYKSLFLYLLEKVQFSEKSYNHHGKDIKIFPGQYCITYRRLVQEYNLNIKFKKEHIDASFLQRAVLLYDKFLWTDTQSDTGIMIITITYPELYEHFKILNNTRNDSSSIQNQYTNEERKEKKNIKETIDDVGSSLLKNNKKIEKTTLNKNLEQESEQNLPRISEDQFQEDFFITCDFIEKNKIPIKTEELERWIRKRGGFIIISNLQLMVKQKKPISNYAAWMETAIRDDWAKLKKNEPINRKFAEDFKSKKSWTELVILKKYCTIERMGYDIPFNFEPETFKETLMSKYENLFRHHSGEPNY